MNVITVIPLSRSKIAQELLYFTSVSVPIGAIVTVPLKKRNISAIVTKIEPAEEIKTDLKKAPFELKKLTKVKSTLFFPSSFIESAKFIADYYATTTGSIIDAMVSDLIIDNVSKLIPPLPPQASLDMIYNDSRSTKRDGKRTYAVQGDDTDRLSAWRSLIRQEFANKRSLVFYCPTTEDCKRLHSALEKGIEGYLFSLNGNAGSKKFTNIWKTIAEIDHPIVIISTAYFPIFPRDDIKTIVIERENSRGWISQKHPYIDLRQTLSIIAQRNNQKIYKADSMLRMETLYLAENEEIEEGSPFKWRSVSLANDILIDMRAKKDPDTKTKFAVLSQELMETIKSLKEENTNLFIFATRRGLSPITVCDDCGNIVMCRKCKTTVVLHRNEETGKNFFMCHICGDRRDADEECSHCGSWKLNPLGIGIDRIYEEIKNNFPDIEIFKVDSDTTKTDKQVEQVIEKFKTKPGSILLGTELAFQNFADKVDHVAIVSLDSLFSLPDFRIQEKMMYTLVRLRAQATRSIIVQTRRAEQKIFEFGLKGNLSDFYRTTIGERKQFSYPPFTILIKITIEGKKESIANTMADVAKYLEPQEIDIFPAFTSTVRGKSIIHGLIKIPSYAWPNAGLVSKLRSLPPNVMVKISPESLL